MNASLDAIIAGAMGEDGLDRSGLTLWLTGAGISAESGIPTFRGEQGYWRVGSTNYRPEEMATNAAFRQMPDEVWGWYLYRRAVCRAAEPNAAHAALSRCEEALSERFLLVTQNVDGLHLRAGNSRARTYEIHGNIDFMRCTNDETHPMQPVPSTFDEWTRGRELVADERAQLRCNTCGAPSRPHVLWFDETYDEAKFRFESSIRAAEQAALLVVVGTTGVTNLPMHIGSLAARRGTPIVVINPEPNPFSDAVERGAKGVYLPGTAGDWVPRVVGRVSRV